MLVYDLTLHKCLADWKFPFLRCVNFFSCFLLFVFWWIDYTLTKIQISARGPPDSWLPVNHLELKYQYLSYQPDNCDNISKQNEQFHRLISSDLALDNRHDSCSVYRNLSILFLNEICGINNNNNETDVETILQNLLPNQIELNDLIWNLVLPTCPSKSHIGILD